jgi:hypothetical protein
MSNTGYIALTSVLIISAVGLAVASTASLLSIGESQSALSLFKGEDMLATVEGCAEDALMKSQEDITYSGGTITRPEGTCQITMTSKVGTTWNITATTTDILYKRSITIIFDRPTSGNITITSWKEV